jgi:Arabinose-binding domain of AraC transcription regulator, N-term
VLVDGQLLREMATEYALMGLLQRARTATGLPVTPLRVTFGAGAPKVTSELADAFGTRAIDFDAGGGAMIISRAYLDQPLVRADPVLAGILRDRADAEIAALGRPRSGSIDSARFSPSASTTSRCCSPRRLGGWPCPLARSSACWNRRGPAGAPKSRRPAALAGRLLAGGMSKTQAARQVGYSDARALRRALCRWGRS